MSHRYAPSGGYSHIRPWNGGQPRGQSNYQNNSIPRNNYSNNNNINTNNTNNSNVYVGYATLAGNWAYAQPENVTGAMQVPNQCQSYQCMVPAVPPPAAAWAPGNYQVAMPYPEAPNGNQFYNSGWNNGGNQANFFQPQPMNEPQVIYGQPIVDVVPFESPSEGRSSVETESDRTTVSTKSSESTSSTSKSSIREENQRGTRGIVGKLQKQIGYLKLLQKESNRKQSTLRKENEELAQQVSQLTDDIDTLKVQVHQLLAKSVSFSKEVTFGFEPSPKSSDKKVSQVPSKSANSTVSVQPDEKIKIRSQSTPRVVKKRASDETSKDLHEETTKEDVPAAQLKEKQETVAEQMKKKEVRREQKTVAEKTTEEEVAVGKTTKKEESNQGPEIVAKPMMKVDVVVQNAMKKEESSQGQEIVAKTMTTKKVVLNAMKKEETHGEQEIVAKPITKVEVVVENAMKKEESNQEQKPVAKTMKMDEVFVEKTTKKEESNRGQVSEMSRVQSTEQAVPKDVELKAVEIKNKKESSETNTVAATFKRELTNSQAKAAEERARRQYREKEEAERKAKQIEMNKRLVAEEKMKAAREAEEKAKEEEEKKKKMLQEATQKQLSKKEKKRSKKAKRTEKKRQSKKEDKEVFDYAGVWNHDYIHNPEPPQSSERGRRGSKRGSKKGSRGQSMTSDIHSIGNDSDSEMPQIPPRPDSNSSREEDCNPPTHIKIPGGMSTDTDDMDIYLAGVGVPLSSIPRLANIYGTIRRV